MASRQKLGVFTIELLIGKGNVSALRISSSSTNVAGELLGEIAQVGQSLPSLLVRAIASGSSGPGESKVCKNDGWWSSRPRLLLAARATSTHFWIMGIVCVSN